MTTAAKIEFKAAAQFNPVFRPVNEWRGRYRILKGSAGSGKSVNIAQDYIAKLSDPAYTGANLLVVRKIEETNRDSTFAELQAAIYRMFGPYYIKDLIDDINWQTSVTSDVLRDVAKFIYILRNYGGQDLAEFLKDLKEHMAIKVTSDGGVDKLQADLNIDAVMAFLDKQRRDLFDFAAAVDTKDPDLGNASGTAINFRYMDLDADCDSLGTELKDTFRRLKLFIDVYFQITGQGDFTNEEFDIVFNMDLPVNETDIINNAVNSNGLLSKRTILQNHPWVTDVDEELARIDEEKKAAMEEYGDGLFNHAMGADDSQEGGDSAGLNGGDGNDE